jgi:hypothetical protein
VVKGRGDKMDAVATMRPQDMMVGDTVGYCIELGATA